MSSSKSTVVSTARADKQILEDFKASDWQLRSELVEQLEDPRLRQLGMRLIFWYAPQFASRAYRSSAQAAIRDRWLANEPNRPWTTQAAVDLQLDEIEGAEALDRDRFVELQDFYRQRISEVS